MSRVRTVAKALIPSGLRHYLRDRDLPFQAQLREIDDLRQANHQLQRENDRLQGEAAQSQADQQGALRQLQRLLDPSYVEVLADGSFQRSRLAAEPYTLLDSCRLANLWTLSRQTDPAGAILEIGSYRGGAALHLANGSPLRRLIVCEAFNQSFESLDPNLDRLFHMEMFRDNSQADVDRLLRDNQCNFEIRAGFFPHSCMNTPLPQISFVHLDVDNYQATLDALRYLVNQGLLLDRSLILLDDVFRNAEGVDRAIAEFLTAYPGWTMLPIFPSQGLLIPKGWFGGDR
jgi:hypothetical protein